MITSNRKHGTLENIICTNFWRLTSTLHYGKKSIDNPIIQFCNHSFLGSIDFLFKSTGFSYRFLVEIHIFTKFNQQSNLLFWIRPAKIVPRMRVKSYSLVVRKHIRTPITNHECLSIVFINFTVGSLLECTVLVFESKMSRFLGEYAKLRLRTLTFFFRRQKARICLINFNIFN